ncbi:type II secretion system GspH family protein [Shewanella eurypsychrophilus]|uniref:Type II secretion system GspH family protein n=1 Tax=Shewanella eurypsychrophilus TaxID=2593656 RepID=A0ABX6VBX5_9GAMM|nr:MULTISPECIES: type II secretion system protein [Shewanella]QFU24643.1 prepilin-type N-terminal cleavage/methylation domain-containing protein [Shewanella sp. YLB-09]QPG59837.1 type II secretion system GspH family protein [Shewanella eurypsychrophilus]
MRNNAGFTLVELVTTIMLIAILAVVVLPRLMTSSSYSAFTLRDEFISELRKAQLMAMNNQDRCYRVDVDASGYQLRRFDNQTCSGTNRTEAKQAFSGGASLTRASDSNDTFNVSFDTAGISSMGCSGPCINVIADETLLIDIESQGYIHGR